MHHAEPSPPLPRRGDWVEKLVVFHFATLFVFTTWAFGGQAPWVRQVIAWWGAAGVGLLVVACFQIGRGRAVASWPALRYLWPLGVYDLLVVASGFNPGFKEVTSGGSRVLVMADPISWLPTAAIPQLAWKELWHVNVIVLSCFNLYLALSGRRMVRLVLYVLAGNAVVLAVFGTFQKLAGAKGLWFGAITSPNARFFSTFIYPNHWGAFIILCTAVCLALLFHSLRRGGQRDIWHSPVLMGVVVTVLLAASVPLSASRACTALIGILLVGALIQFLTRVIRRRREQRASAVLPVVGIILAALLATGAVAYLGRDVIAQRARLTSEQFSHLAKEDTLNSRLTLYRDTWRMAAAKPWFGWGLESYAHVFYVFNSQRAVERWVWIPFYAEAHSDWLQSLAETGFVGTILLVLLVLLPLRAIRWRSVESVVPRYLLAGCALVLLYAWIEFPFANPAVLLTFWAAFYCALRYADLELRAQERADHD